MNKPTVEDIIKGMMMTQEDPTEKPSRYAAVMVVAKRGRQINSYYRSLGEGGAFEDIAPPLVTTASRNYLTISMEEVARGEIAYRIRSESA
ncbi:MAG: DNA-directed RNA polymerase subunit omega [Thermoleophilia bacterium]|nr:DNA-directed RNA polymerase subunit omega [Thermoleophilia bacterium]